MGCTVSQSPSKNNQNCELFQRAGQTSKRSMIFDHTLRSHRTVSFGSSLNDTESQYSRLDSKHEELKKKIQKYRDYIEQSNEQLNYYSNMGEKSFVSKGQSISTNVTPRKERQENKENIIETKRGNGTCVSRDDVRKFIEKYESMLITQEDWQEQEQSYDQSRLISKFEQIKEQFGIPVKIRNNSEASHMESSKNSDMEKSLQQPYREPSYYPQSNGRISFNYFDQKIPEKDFQITDYRTPAKKEQELCYQRGYEEEQTFSPQMPQSYSKVSIPDGLYQIREEEDDYGSTSANNFESFYDERIKQSVATIDKRIKQQEQVFQGSNTNQKSFQQYYHEFVEDEVTGIDQDIQEIKRFLKKVGSAGLRLKSSLKDLYRAVTFNSLENVGLEQRIGSVNDNLNAIERIRNQMHDDIGNMKENRSRRNSNSIDQLKNMKEQIYQYFEKVEHQIRIINDQYTDTDSQTFCSSQQSQAPHFEDYQQKQYLTQKHYETFTYEFDEQQYP